MAYFDTKSGSLEEAIRQAVGGQKVQEKVEYVEYKFKNKNDAMKAKNYFDGIQLMGFDVNDDGASQGELSVEADGGKDMTKYHNEVMKKFKPKVVVQEKMDAVNKTAVKKKFDDRKDKDIDNDGDVDSSDKFLHKRRKAISKAMSKDEGNKFGKALADARENGDKTFVVSGQTYNVEDYNQDENYDVGTPENTKAKLDATPGQSQDDWNQQVETMQQKNISMREALAKMWGVEEGHNPFKKEEKKASKKEGKTMTGQPETKVTIDPDMKEKVK